MNPGENMHDIQIDLLFAICQNIPDAICFIDKEWNIQSWNKGAETMLGYGADEIIGKSLRIIIPEEIAQREIEHCIGELHAKGKMSGYETLRRAKDGRIIPIELTAVLLKDDGNITGYASIMRDISERLNFQKELTASETNLRTIFNSVNDAIFVHNIETGRILEVNDKFFEMYGYSPEEAQELNVQSLSAGISEHTEEQALQLIKKAASGEPQSFEWAAKSKTGKIFPVEVNLRRVLLKGEDRIIATVRDISERKQTEEALKLMQFSVDHASVCAYLVGRDARFLYVNEQTCRTLGYSRKELLSMAVYDLDPDYPLSLWDEHWKQLKNKGSLHFETKQRNKQGKLVPIELSLNFLSFRGQEYNVAFGLDISNRKKAEQELVKISRRNELILESAAEGIFGINNEGNHTFVNSSGRKMLGYDAHELIGRHSHPIWHHTRPDGTPYPEEDCTIYMTVRDGVSRQVDDEVFWKKDGTPVPVEYTTTPIREDAVIVGTVVTFRDITDRKEADRRLRESEEKYRSIVMTSADWIWEVDLKGILTFNNPAVEQILGYRPDELIGKSNFEFMYEEDREKGTLIFERAMREREGWKKDLLRWKHKDGSLRYIESNSVPIFDETGALKGFRGFDRDVSEIRRAQDNLQIAYEELETKVRERTRELAKANEELRMEVVERRRAVDVIRKSKELGDTLNRLGTLIYSTLDINEILQRVVEEAAKSLHVDASMIGLFEDGIFRIRYVYNMPKAFSEKILTSNELRGLHHATKARDAVAFNDAFNDDRLNNQFVRKMGIQSFIVAPITIKNRIQGAITFYGISNRIEFGEEHIDFARKLGASVSLALENARLYHALQEAETLSASRFRQIQTIYDTAPVGLCFIDTSKRFISINKKLAEINNVPVEKAIGRTVREVIPETADLIEELCNQAIETGQPVENVEIAVTTKSSMTVLANYYPIRDETGAILGVNIVVQDITRRKRAEEALRTSERWSRAILDGIPDMAWLKDRQGRFILINEPFAAAAGKHAKDLVGKTDFDIWPTGMAERYQTDDQDVMKRRAAKRVEEPLSASDGIIRWIETIKTPVRNEHGEVVGTVGIARDITERKRMEDEIRHMAQHDALTGLPNRRFFVDIMKLELAQARRHKSKCGILFIDLDRFKEVNDTLGHEAGDQLLMQVARRLRETIRESDTVARIGGDEFNMILADLAHSEDASEIAVKIVKSLQGPFIVNGHELHITTSIGISIYPDDAEEIDNLLRFADIAMYHAKESGRNTFRFYNPSINVRSIEKMKLESWLRQTIVRGELSVHYQPQIDIKTKKIAYAEALVRWNHPERGLLEPRDFLPLAEETGFITSIDEWVLRTVCTQATSWKESGFDSFCVTVNLSARQFQSPDLVKMVTSVLKETGMSPSCLDIEVTENAAMSDIEQTASQLRELTGMGVHFSIDDFGTGYSSLNYLKKLPIERIKIDKSFIHDIATDPDDRAIISAVSSMAHQMGIGTVAEGVETEEQLAFVREAGCDEVQGFLDEQTGACPGFREVDRFPVKNRFRETVNKTPRSLACSGTGYLLMIAPPLMGERCGEGELSGFTLVTPT